MEYNTVVLENDLRRCGAPYAYYGGKRTMVKIKWTNKFSNETGYVASVSAKNKCFVNTFDKNEAKEYSEKAVKGILTKLGSYNETENNIFEVVEA